MSYQVKHKQVGASDYYLLERWDEAHREHALRRARNYALDHGGFVSVLDHEDRCVFTTERAAS